MISENLILLFCIAAFIMPFLFSINVVLVGVIFANARAVARVKSWVPTTGLMTTSEMQRIKIGRTRSLLPVVEYTYQVNGQSYKGNNLLPVAGTASGTLLKKVVARHPAGAETTVYYDPQNPAEAVLEKTSPVVSFLVWVLIFSNIVICAVLPFAWWLVERTK